MNINKNSFLFDEISSLRGVGKKTKKYLSNKKIEKIKDILWDLPYASIDRSKITSLKELEIGKITTIKVINLIFQMTKTQYKKISKLRKSLI